ncbi:Probable prolyl 4-hydroxylase [Seminavis robusta]|uniref:Probable prolyl 4-hydroxylase n=1 Tax=Seminavis robusta TaxID=568900 RepID=A0A9N8H340_9STRA|nr:Probable prolyl 4-hydroxylase [Seminavis robusta]|eukprot:Sro80_g042910.1 Probable prolyl 4-hydroxylase (510) ;mRNA; r:5774-7601
MFLHVTVLLLVLSLAPCLDAESTTTTCSLDQQNRDAHQRRDPCLQEMQYNISGTQGSFWAYVEPDVNTMYNGNPPASTKVEFPKFNGFSVKFINMSNKRLILKWVPFDKNQPPVQMSVMLPFHEAGTASFPGHNFILTDEYDTEYHRFVIGDSPAEANLQVYDPYRVEGPEDPVATERTLQQVLAPHERQQYDQLRDTLLFHEQYQQFTGRSYLANYLRDPPRHFIWPVTHFGQQFWVTTPETHFTQLPPAQLLNPVTTDDTARHQNPVLTDYRDRDSQLNMTLTVLSVAPRVLEIPNFLSATEIQHILQIATGMELSRSTVGNSEKDLQKRQAAEVKTDTRTSFNSWLKREKSPVIDAIYRRAADLMRIDEALFREHTDSNDELKKKKSLAEQLQLVHYDPGQEYTAHHDFGYRDLKKNQKARFSTLLLYLNHEGLEAGETTFPRWRNAETFLPLKVKPQAGKAVLFYSQLPDGNFDDYSQHSAAPPTKGEKWLINLWTWSPYMDDDE